MMEKTTVPYATMTERPVSTDSLFKNCCFFFPLRTGCFILGYLHLVLNAFRTLFVTMITLYVGIKSFSPRVAPSDSELQGLGERKTITAYLDSMDRETLQAVEWVMLIVLAANLIWLGVNIACLVGLHKRRPGPIRVYIGFACSRFIISLVAYIYQLNYNASKIFVSTLDLGLSAYFIFVYYVYAKQLERENQRAQQVTLAQPPAYYPETISYPTKLDKEQLVV